jgi:hypothetical protein
MQQKKLNKLKIAIDIDRRLCFNMFDVTLQKWGGEDSSVKLFLLSD